MKIYYAVFRIKAVLHYIFTFSYMIINRFKQFHFWVKNVMTISSSDLIEFQKQ